ncbi:MAG: DUF3263 domain-containing protein [Rhodoglobus sp.]
MSASPEPVNEPLLALSARDASILDFERDWWGHAGPKEEAIRLQFSFSTARYYQLLNTVIDLPEAVRHDPMLVKRLQRARAARTAARAARVFLHSDHRGIIAPDEESTT